MIARLGQTVVRGSKVLVYRPYSALYYSDFRLQLIDAESRSRCLAQPRCESLAGPAGAVAVHSAGPRATKPDCFGGRSRQIQSADRWGTAVAGSDGQSVAPRLCQQGT